MLKLYPEQLRAQLNEGLRAAYLLLGNDPLLLQESHDAVRQAAFAQDFTEHHAFTIDASTDWDAIYAICRALSLFASRQILSLQLPENGPNAALNERLAMLVGLLHDDLILIVRGNKLTKARKMPLVYCSGQSQRFGQLSDPGAGQSTPLGCRTCKAEQPATGRCRQSVALLLLRRESIGRRAGAGKAGAALPGR